MNIKVDNHINIKTASVLIFIYFFFFKFYNFQPLVGWMVYNELMDVVVIAAFLFFFRDIFKIRKSNTIDKHIYRIIILYMCSIVSALLFNEQSVYHSLRSLSALLPIIFFFILKKYAVDINTLKFVVVVLAVTHCIVLLYALSSYPSQIFGCISESALSQAEQSIEQRGVVRLGVPGNDFVVFLLFIVLTKYKEKKLYYLLLIPLVIVILLRGTRTPVFVCLIVMFGYIIWSIKNKFFVIIACGALLVTIPYVYDILLSSNSDNVIVKYIQLTHNQLENNMEEDDIRVKNVSYFFGEFNDNIFTSLCGNGVPNPQSAYGEKMSKLQSAEHFWIQDSGFSYIYVCFGIIGMIVFGLLFIYILRVKIPDKYMFAKLYLIYSYLILPTNIGFIVLTPLIASLAFYVFSLANGKTAQTSKI